MGTAPEELTAVRQWVLRRAAPRRGEEVESYSVCVVEPVGTCGAVVRMCVDVESGVMSFCGCNSKSRVSQICQGK